MTSWQALQQELERWSEPATFWWRDDDATRSGPALEHLLNLASHHGLPLHLAVIPALSDASLAQRLDHANVVWVLQHGYDHSPHAHPGERKRELGGPRPRDEILQQLALGRAQLQQLFGDRVLDILVPPWNRIDDDLLPLLPPLGYRRLSVLGPRRTEPTGLPEINVHIDIIDWRQRRFAGSGVALQQLLRHLEGRRRGDVDPTEPTGLMTHHRDHDDGCWAFLDELLTVLSETGAVRWLDGPELLIS